MRKAESKLTLERFQEPLKVTVVDEGKPLTPEQKEQEQAFLDGFDNWQKKKNKNEE